MRPGAIVDGGRLRSGLVLAVFVGAWAVGWQGTPQQAQAQLQSIPTETYFAAINNLYDQGEYVQALKRFQEEWQHGAVKSAIQPQWIDSICYHTMMGECYYQMGDLDNALEQYTNAVRLYLMFPDWMIRVVFPAGIRPSSAMPLIPWGPSTRRAFKGYYPLTVNMGQGRLDNTQQYTQGGIVQQAMLMPIHAQEIVRCTILAIRRRAELMGPLCQVDATTGQLISVLRGRPAPPNHWSQTWVEVEYAMALLGGGRQTEALSSLSRSVVAAGQYDHPFTSTVLLELGRMALLRGDNVTAARSFFEASISAVEYPDAGVLEESLRYGALTHLVANQRGIYPPLLPAAKWAIRLRQLQASLFLSQAENLAVLGQTPRAATALDEAHLAIGNRSMGAGRVGARGNYLRALVSFQKGKIAAGDEFFNLFLTYMRHGSHWLYQVFQVDRCFAGGQITSRGPITPRAAMELYGELLRDPLPIDWSIRPMEALAALTVPHSPSWEHWFLVALERKDHEAALEISDRARRHRFLSSLGYGGRLESLRWILEAPETDLDRTALLQRQNLLAGYPAYAKLSQQARSLRQRLQAMPLVPGDNATFQRQSQGLGQLAAIGTTQEAMLREIALRREAASLVFPPLKSTKEIQTLLPPGQALLSFFVAGGDIYAFLMNKDHYGSWRIKSPALVLRKTGNLLREMGNYEQNRELSLKDLVDSAWKQSAKQVLDAILDGSQADFTARFPEMVIVPDGFLWYVPFEALQVNVQDQLRPLISRFRIRYAPTVSLAVPEGPGLNPAGQTAVVLGRLYGREDEDAPQKAFAELSKSVPHCVALPSKPPLPAASSVYAVLMDRLIVLDDIANISEQKPYAWSPIQIERGKPGNTLDDWFLLPFGGPEVVILPGFHTAAENGMKRSTPGMAGSEVFLSVLGLMSNGAKTILLSRWRTGGQSSYDIVREFAQELPHTTPADAWQRAVLVTADSRLNLEAEPRIKKAAVDDPPRGNHPFFWSGYMLVDRGQKPEVVEDDDDDLPVVKEKKEEAPPPPKPVLKLRNKPAGAAP
jgi:CHAT domain-containing protein